MKDLFAALRSFLTPSDPASWQTLMLLSLFSVVMAAFMSSVVQGIVSFCGWAFLIAAVWWFIHEKDVQSALTFNGIFTKIFVGPWIVATLFGIATFGSWSGFAKLSTVAPAAIICIPPIAAAITLAPKFIKTTADKTPAFTIPEAKHRQGMALFVLSHLLIACWFQFYFLIQGWLNLYPSLMAEDFNRSSFVIRVQPAVQASRGKEVLNAAESELRDRFNNQSWGNIERWLFESKVSDNWANELEKNVQSRLKNKFGGGEMELWKLSGKATGDTYDSGAYYNLLLNATWKGPTATQSNYTVTKRCELSPKRTFSKKAGSPIPESKVIGTLRCADVTEPKRSFVQKKS
jgi:Family of unknown function (DUF5357)